MFAFDSYSAVSDHNLSVLAKLFRIAFTILLYFSICDSLCENQSYSPLEQGCFSQRGSHMLAFNYLCCICFVVFNSTFIFAFHFYSAVFHNLSVRANLFRIAFTILLYFSICWLLTICVAFLL